jgi:hypothetical protein
MRRKKCRLQGNFLTKYRLKAIYEACLSALMLEKLEKTTDVDHRVKMLTFAGELHVQVFTLTEEINRIAKQKFGRNTTKKLNT